MFVWELSPCMRTRCREETSCLPHGPYECLVDRYPRWNADKIFADYMGKIFVHFVSDSVFILKEQLFPQPEIHLKTTAHKLFKAVLYQETSIQLIPQTSEKEASCNTMRNQRDPEVASYCETCVDFHRFSWWIYVERQEIMCQFVPPDMFKMLSFQTLSTYDKVILKFIRFGWNMMNLTLFGRVTWHGICMTCWHPALKTIREDSSQLSDPPDMITTKIN